MEINKVPETVYDLDTEKEIPNTDFKKPEPPKEEEENEEEEEQEQETKNPKSKKEDESEEEEEEPDDSKNDESEEEEEEEEDDKDKDESEEEEEEEEGDDKEKDDDTLTPDAYIEQEFGEKFKVKTKDELVDLVEKALDVMDELDTVKKERDQLKSESGKIKFDDPGQESAFNFVKKFDPTMQGEALQTFAKLIGMDLEKADPVMLLEEKFIHDHPEWTRAEAIRMFKKDYTKKYEFPREKFDGTDAEYEEEKQDREIMKKGDIAKAKTFLTDLKLKHKPAEKEQPKQNELVTKAIEQNVPKIATFIESKKEVAFGKSDKFNFVLDADKKKAIASAMKDWANSPSSYNDKGQLVGVDNEEQMLKTVIATLYPDDLVQFAFDRANSKAKITRAEELEGKKVKKRKAPGSGEPVEGNLDDSAVQLIKQRNKKAA